LYIPPKKPIHEVIAYLRNEWGTAGNIKSDTTRNHVQDALTKTQQRLKLYRETPDNGLVIFCGALPTNGPGSEVIVLREVVPPKPVKSFLYMCDDHFHVEYLKDMLREEMVYGLLSIDSSEVGIGILSGETFEIVNVMTSGISGKTRKGDSRPVGMRGVGRWISHTSTTGSQTTRTGFSWTSTMSLGWSWEALVIRKRTS
jgi:peptide chain release factor subunit 1